MRTAAALLAVMAMPLSVVAGVQRAETPGAASLAATMAVVYGVTSFGLWIAAEMVAWWRGRARGSAGGWR